jgi:dihydroneopterin aldolase
MTDQITIELKELRFFAFHGLYPEEQKTGNEFEVNISVTRNIKSSIIKELSETLNYAELFELIKDEMKKPRALLETFAMELAQLIHLSFEGVKKVDIEIAKLHLPVKRFSGTAAVKYSKSY